MPEPGSGLRHGSLNRVDRVRSNLKICIRAIYTLPTNVTSREKIMFPRLLIRGSNLHQHIAEPLTNLAKDILSSSSSKMAKSKV